MIKLRGFILILLIAAGGWLLYDQGTRPSPNSGRGMAGMEFVVPPEYAEVPLGEASYAQAADSLLVRLEPGFKAAAVFTREGDRIHLLVDLEAGVVEEHILGRSGVLRKIHWDGPVEKRLKWAAEHGDLAVPDMAPAVDRNAYH